MPPVRLHLDRVIDARALRDGLDAIAAGHDASEPHVRSRILAHLKSVDAASMQAVRDMLNDDGSGRACASRIAAQRDVLVRAIHDFALAHVLRIANPSLNERLCVVAVGGYGRGHMAPRSDLDLLFITPARQNAAVEQLVEYILYMLWDLGLTVGHATRTLDECIRQARADMTVRTAMLESRYLHGEEALHDELVERFDAEIVAGTAKEFIAAKLEERDARHEKAGRSRYLVEPNVKEGKGGLRDFQTLYWIGKYAFRVRSVEDLVARNLLSKRELRRFRQAQGFLWAVRAHMHFETGREEDRLHFELQPVIAERLGYAEGRGQRPVERFMRHYFLHAKAVGDLTRIFCAELEADQAKAAPKLDRIGVAGVSLGTIARAFTDRAKPIPDTPFTIRNGRIDVADETLFERDPVAIVELFAVAEREDVPFHPDALHLVSRNLKRIDKHVRADPRAVEAFMAVLTSRRDPEGYLRRMNESGVLGRFVPEFGRIVAQMQFSLYHHYTVDEHLLRSIGVAHEIEAKHSAERHPVATEIFPTLDRTVIFTALILHDIAKGRPEDHSVAGARIARKVCPRLGLTPSQTELVSWLIAEHLTMSETAQSRDLSDYRTIADFAATVQSLARLRHLMVLTVCDIRAVGPGTYNGWKGQLLHTLYAEAENHLTGGFSKTPREERAAHGRDALVRRLTEGGSMPSHEANRIANLHYPSYLLATPVPTQMRHAGMIAGADASAAPLTTAVHLSGPITEIDVLAPDHPHLLSLLAGACAAGGADIVGAKIATMQDGRALDTIVIRRLFPENAEGDRDELRRAARVRELLRALLAGEERVPQAVASRQRKRRVSKAFTVEPEIRIDNDLSNLFTVIEVEGLDRIGLLAEITDVLSDLMLDIASAQIVTYGEKVIDTFYVRDLVGAKITSETRLATIREQLLALFDPARTT